MQPVFIYLNYLVTMESFLKIHKFCHLLNRLSHLTERYEQENFAVEEMIFWNFRVDQRKFDSKCKKQKWKKIKITYLVAQ